MGCFFIASGSRGGKARKGQPADEFRKGGPQQRPAYRKSVFKMLQSFRSSTLIRLKLQLSTVDVRVRWIAGSC